MRKNILWEIIIIGYLFIILFTGMHSDENKIITNVPKYIIAYYSSDSHIYPDVKYFTHLNYAFAEIDSLNYGIKIQNLQNFKKLISIKDSNPEIKILLSIGGWGAGNFSEMASTKQNRQIFVTSCREAILTYNLDGIDLDWEYPGSSLSGISSSKYDRANFTILIRELREELGHNALITMASPNYGNFYDFRDFIDELNWVNIMAYDMATPPFHHSPIRRSSNVKNESVIDVIEHHLSMGIPNDKLVLGVPFYGRGDKKNYGNFIYFKNIKTKNHTKLKYDMVAESPYIVDENNRLILSFDDSLSISKKCNLIKRKNLRGVMYWHYSCDEPSQILKKSIIEEFKK